MRIGMIGVNHKTADVGLRERIAHVAQGRLEHQHFLPERLSYVLLSTCNRTEVYFSAYSLADAHSALLQLLQREISEEFSHRLYAYFGSDCFSHLVKVTAGLDSAILAETEIQGQVKQAYTLASQRRLAHELHFLFQKSLKIGRELRHSTLSLHSAPTLSQTIVDIVRDILPLSQHIRILFVGASEIHASLFQSLRKALPGERSLCNRSQERALEVAQREGLLLLPWEERHRWTEYDVVLFGTKAGYYLARREEVRAPLHSPKVLIDLSVPRNVDPRLESVPQISLFNIDALHQRMGNPPLDYPSIATAVQRQISLFFAKRFRKPHDPECAERESPREYSRPQ